MVVWIDSCPRCCWMTGKGTPAWIIHDAHVWRRSCTRGDFVKPAFIALSRPGFQPPLKNSCARTGLPAPFVNRKPGAVRSTTSSAAGGRLIVRSDLWPVITGVLPRLVYSARLRLDVDVRAAQGSRLREAHTGRDQPSG